MSRATPIQQRSKVKREVVLAAATIVIARKGRDRFTTADVADQAGASIGTVYRYFRDRVDILDSLYPNRREGLSSLDMGMQSISFSPFPQKPQDVGLNEGAHHKS